MVKRISWQVSEHHETSFPFPSCRDRGFLGNTQSLQHPVFWPTLKGQMCPGSTFPFDSVKGVIPQTQIVSLALLHVASGMWDLTQLPRKRVLSVRSGAQVSVF